MTAKTLISKKIGYNWFYTVLGSTMPLCALYPSPPPLVVLGCTSLLVSTAEEALGWLEVGNSSRVTGATHMNAKSSRSHAIFTVHIRKYIVTVPILPFKNY